MGEKGFHCSGAAWEQGRGLQQAYGTGDGSREVRLPGSEEALGDRRDQRRRWREWWRRTNGGDRAGGAGP